MFIGILERDFDASKCGTFPFYNLNLSEFLLFCPIYSGSFGKKAV